MNGWYGAAIAGLVLLVEGFVNMIVHLTKKLEWRSDAIRAVSGGCTLLLSYLSIRFSWFGADIAVGYNPLYSLSFAGFVLLMESFFSYMVAKLIFKSKHDASIDFSRFWIGFVIFCIGLIALIIGGD